MKRIRQDYKRVSSGDYMGRGANNNLRVASIIHKYLLETGPKTVSEIKDYLNNTYKYGRGETHPAKKPTRTSLSSMQVAGIVRSSPLFKKGETETIRYANWNRLPIGKNYVNHNDVRWTLDAKKKQPLAKTNTVKGEVFSWSAIPIEKVVDKMLGDDGKLPQHRIRKRYPSIINEELKRRGIKV